MRNRIYIRICKLRIIKLGIYTKGSWLCGHATIGSFAILMHVNKLFRIYTVETDSGVLTITIKDDIIFMEQNRPIFYDVISKQSSLTVLIVKL